MPAHISERRTEDIAVELLEVQGWRTQRPPRGQTVRQNEYKDFPALAAIFRGSSKKGRGDAYPDFLLLDAHSNTPQLVVETKASDSDVADALADAVHYADTCRVASHPTIAVGVAGSIPAPPTILR